LHIGIAIADEDSFPLSVSNGITFAKGSSIAASSYSGLDMELEDRLVWNGPSRCAGMSFSS